MKQFQYVGRDGLHHGPYSAKEVPELFPLSATGVAELNGTSTYTDLDGDVWSIAPDLSDQQAERLERIATRLFASMVNASPMLSDAVLARTAVDFANTLIAELDKQS